MPAITLNLGYFGESSTLEGFHQINCFKAIGLTLNSSQQGFTFPSSFSLKLLQGVNALNEVVIKKFGSRQIVNPISSNRQLSPFLKIQGKPLKKPDADAILNENLIINKVCYDSLRSPFLQTKRFCAFLTFISRMFSD